ncbi:MAG TPA: phage major capsid protein [Bacillota bacterium]|nr:phage major capsid protein [Bacillota bacterium]
MRKNEIEKRMAEIKGILSSEAECNIDELETEIRSLKAEIVEIEQREKRSKMAEKLQNNMVEARKVDELKKDAINEAEKQGQALKEKRAVTLASNGVFLQQHQSTDIKPTFNQVSSLVDRINVRTLPGGESFKQSYLTGYGEGDYTGEGGNPATAETTFGYADITKTKITAYAEDSEELVKLPAADFAGEVQKGISVAIRKKLTKEILVGDGAAGHFIGIFDDGATAIDSATDMDLTKIDETTLDEIIFSFGGDENVEDVAVLVLNKSDLKKFATLRNSIGEKVYDVKTSGNTGTIDGVPFIINSACKAVSATGTTSGQYCMAYGPLSNYTMAIFSNLDVQRSTDYKFKEGMIAHRGVVFAGGNVTAKNGFLRVKKG